MTEKYPDNENDPPSTTSEGRSKDSVAAKATVANALSVSGSVARPLPMAGRRGRRDRAPVVFASVYAPAGRRTQWAFAYVCAHCGGGHFGRAASEDAVRRRHRGSCGRLVSVRPARVYRGADRTAATA